MIKKFTLGSKERLKSRKAIDELFEKGKSFNSQPFRVLFNTQQKPGLRFGVGVSVRYFKKAVDRNLVKRRVREAYRQQNLELKKYLEAEKKGMDIFFTYTAREIFPFTEISSSMQKILEKLIERQ